MHVPVIGSQFLRFVAAGGTSVVFNFATRHLLGHVMPFELAVALAYLVGMAIAYGLTRWLVFPASGRGSLSELTRFAIVNAGSLAIVMAVSVTLLRGVFPAIGFVWHAEDVAHLIGLSGTAVTAFLGHWLFTFAPIAKTHGPASRSSYAPASRSSD